MRTTGCFGGGREKGLALKTEIRAFLKKSVDNDDGWCYDLTQDHTAKEGGPMRNNRMNSSYYYFSFTFARKALLRCAV